MDTEDYNVLQLLREVLVTERSFHSIVRFLDGNTRNHIVAAQLRNSSQLLSIVRTYVSHPPVVNRENIVMNIPLNAILDPSGTFMRSFMEPVPVVPTHDQIQAATENHVGTADTLCAICQENVTCATRIRHCGHCFHSQCIYEWFSMNTRCPVCRHDIRDLQPARATSNNVNRRGHADE
jgi:hypothetical protein